MPVITWKYSTSVGNLYLDSEFTAGTEYVVDLFGLDILVGSAHETVKTFVDVTVPEIPTTVVPV